LPRAKYFSPALTTTVRVSTKSRTVTLPFTTRARVLLLQLSSVSHLVPHTVAELYWP
jgi:hypothetical protein